MMEELAQQKSGQSSTTTPSAGMPAAGGDQHSQLGATGLPGQKSKPPRGFSTVQQELKYFGDDALDAVLSFMPQFMRNMFGRTPQDTPETLAKKKQMLQKYQQLTTEQQQYAQQRLQEQEQQKQAQEQEKQFKIQQAAQQKQNELATPAGKRSGMGALDKLNDDRKKLGSAGAG
jgi:hypothetical protein